MDEIKFKELIKARVSKKQKKQIKKIINYARFCYIGSENETITGKKYKNESHFLRCAVIKLIDLEKKELESYRGRPPKYKEY